MKKRNFENKEMKFSKISNDRTETQMKINFNDAYKIECKQDNGRHEENLKLE